MTCLVSSCCETDSDIGVLLFYASILIAILAGGARGFWSVLAVLPPGVVGLCFFNTCGRAELAWIPSYLGLLLAIYNLGSARPWTIPIALGQLMVVSAPTLSLATKSLPVAIL